MKTAPAALTLAVVSALSLFIALALFAHVGALTPDPAAVCGAAECTASQLSELRAGWQLFIDRATLAVGAVAVLSVIIAVVARGSKYAGLARTYAASLSTLAFGIMLGALTATVAMPLGSVAMLTQRRALMMAILWLLAAKVLGALAYLHQKRHA